MRASGNHGFTVPELMIVMTVMGIISGVLIAFYGEAELVLQRGISQTSLQQTARLASIRTIPKITSAVPKPADPDDLSNPDPVPAIVSPAPPPNDATPAVETRELVLNSITPYVEELWLNMATFKLGGDYHTNDRARISIPNKNFWKNSAPAIGGKVTFSDLYTANAADFVQYNSWDANLLPYDPGDGSSVPGRYEKITAHGRLGIQATEKLELPKNTDSVAFGTWGGTPPAPGALATGPAAGGAFFGTGASANGVNARINGALPGGEARNGIYIEGDVDQIDLELINSNQLMRIDQGSHEIEVTFVTNSFTLPAGSNVNGAVLPAAQNLLGSANDGRGFTVVRKAGTSQYKVYQGQTNGAVYVTGDVNGIRGTVKGRRTVATMTGEGGATAQDREIKITGPLLYAGTTPGQAPSTADDQLGLISYAVRMDQDQASAAPSTSNNRDGQMWPKRNTTSPSKPHYLYCSIFAGRNGDPNWDTHEPMENAGGFGVEDPNSTSLGPGHMVLFGSLTEGVRQQKGTFNPSNGESRSGYSYAFFEDPNLKQTQPPFFPTLPRYNVISWQERSVFAY